MADTRGWLTTEEAAQFTGYNLEYIRRLIRAKKIEAKKWGRDWIIRQSSLGNYLGKGRRRGPRGDQTKVGK